MKRVAVIDIGSNTLKIVVAEKGESTPLNVLFQSVAECRISTGIGQGGSLCFSDEILDKAADAVQSLIDAASEYQPEQIEIVATSAVRDAENGEDFIAAIKAKTGITLQIFSGDEEVQGICDGILCDPNLCQLDDFLFIDIGGGSLEICEVSERKPIQAQSLQLGAVRLTEQFISNPKHPFNPQNSMPLSAMC